MAKIPPVKRLVAATWPSGMQDVLLVEVHDSTEHSQHKQMGWYQGTFCILVEAYWVGEHALHNSDVQESVAGTAGPLEQGRQAGNGPSS